MKEIINTLREIAEVLQYSFDEPIDEMFVKVHRPTPRDMIISNKLSKLADELENQKECKS